MHCIDRNELVLFVEPGKTRLTWSVCPLSTAWLLDHLMVRRPVRSGPGPGPLPEQLTHDVDDDDGPLRYTLAAGSGRRRIFQVRMRLNGYRTLV